MSRVDSQRACREPTQNRKDNPAHRQHHAGRHDFLGSAKTQAKHHGEPQRHQEGQEITGQKMEERDPVRDGQQRGAGERGRERNPAPGKPPAGEASGNQDHPKTPKSRRQPERSSSPPSPAFSLAQLPSRSVRRFHALRRAFNENPARGQEDPGKAPRRPKIQRKP